MRQSFRIASMLATIGRIILWILLLAVALFVGWLLEPFGL
jgi:hypothetical protein